MILTFAVPVLGPVFGLTETILLIGLLVLVPFLSHARWPRSKGLMLAIGLASALSFMLPSLYLICEPGWLWFLFESCPPPS
jgi:hypothetical protein